MRKIQQTILAIIFLCMSIVCFGGIDLRSESSEVHHLPIDTALCFPFTGVVFEVNSLINGRTVYSLIPIELVLRVGTRSEVAEPVVESIPIEVIHQFIWPGVLQPSGQEYITVDLVCKVHTNIWFSVTNPVVTAQRVLHLSNVTFVTYLTEYGGSVRQFEGVNGLTIHDALNEYVCLLTEPSVGISHDADGNGTLGRMPILERLQSNVFPFKLNISNPSGIGPLTDLHKNSINGSPVSSLQGIISSLIKQN